MLHLQTYCCVSIQDQENLAEPKKNESLMNTISIQEELLIKNDPEKTSQASLHSKASGKITGIFNQASVDSSKYGFIERQMNRKKLSIAAALANVSSNNQYDKLADTEQSNGSQAH